MAKKEPEVQAAGQEPGLPEPGKDFPFWLEDENESQEQEQLGDGGLHCVFCEGEVKQSQAGVDLSE